MEHDYRVPPLAQPHPARDTTLPIWVQIGILPLLLGVGSLLLYLLTLTHAHTFDALSYALDVDRKPWQEVLHPHHLAYGPLGELVALLARSMGWQQSVVLPLQITNALAGSLGVVLMYLVLRQNTRRSDVALVAALLLGGSFAYWYYAVEVEVYTIAAVLLVGCMGLILHALHTAKPWVWIGLGVLHGLAILFHQTNVLLAVPIGATLLLATSRAIPQRTTRHYATHLLGASIAYALPLLAVVGGAYAVALLAGDLHSLAEVHAWLTSYARVGWWGGSITDPQKWHDLGRALNILLVHPGGAIALLLLGVLLLVYARALVRHYRPHVLVLLLWLFVYGTFFYWWEPANIEFWIASLPPAIALLALALVAGGAVWHAGVWLALATAAAMISLNFHEVRLRGSGALTPQYQITGALTRNTQPGDLLLVPDGLQKLYLHHYAGRLNTLSLNQTLQSTGGDWAAACQQFQQHIEATLHGGAAVMIADGVLDPTGVTTSYGDPLLDRFDVSPAAVQQCFAPYQAAFQHVPLDAGMPTYYRIPTATEQLALGGWDFTQVPARWGWRIDNVLESYFDGDGWGFFPVQDPYLTSPRMDIDTSQYQGIEIRLAHKVSNREGQIFFVDQQGLAEEARSVRWELAKHSRLKTYYLDLRDQPSWTGTLAGLRIDPTTGRDHDDGEPVQIAWIKLIPVEQGSN